jgi:predicted acylesterase/phospholipase RssA/CRP-like cAMP-binding protein
VLGAFALALLLGIYFVLRSTRQRTPIVDLSLVRIRAFALSNSVTLVMAGGFYAYTLCNVLFLTTVWRYSILQAGFALTPGPIVAIAVAGPASRLVVRVGHRAVVVPGALVWAGGMAYFATQLGARPDFLGQWLPGMAILGLGAGLTFPTLSGAAVGSVPGPRFAVATSLNSVARQMGAALGVAILIAILGKPSPEQALHHFEHGWTFAGVCFLAGSLASLALVVRPSAEIALSAGLPGASALAGHGLDEPGRITASGASSGIRQLSELPSLAEAEGARPSGSAQTVAEFLRGVPVFAALSPDMLERVGRLAEDVSLDSGAWLFREGDAADGLYVVRVGHLEVIQGDLQAQRINTLTRGAVLGELALLNDSPRSASIRALRDSELLKIDKAHFDALLQAEPQLALSLTRVLSTQLQASRAIPPARRARPVTIALVALDASSPALELADELTRAMCAWGSTAVLHPAPSQQAQGGGTSPEQDAERETVISRADAVARYGPQVERCESDHDQVVMVCGPDAQPPGWREFCIARADRVLALLDARTAQTPADAQVHALDGCDLVGYGLAPGEGQLDDWIERLEPTGLFALSPGAKRRSDIARMARRLAGRASGVVLSGGGARAFAHLGVLDVLLDAGLVVDRVGGVSMGAFVGGLLAAGHDSIAIDAYCYEEWVRRNPINDYTIPRHSLIKGHKAEAMLERVFGEARIEQLARSFYCASVNLRGNRLVIDRHGPLTTAVGASISLPLIGPPLRRDDGLMIDGSLLDNLPLAPMSSSGEGPVLAIDIKGGEERPRPAATVIADGAPSPAQGGADALPARRSKRLPLLPETMARIALLSSANTDESARRHADMTITVRVPGVGLLEFHQIDAAREAGRRAALAALEGAPKWLLNGGVSETAGAVGRRTVVRV